MLNESQENESEALITHLVKALQADVPSSVVPADMRQQVAEEFVEFLGKLVSFFEANMPATPAKNAALLVFYDRLGLDRVPKSTAVTMMALVEAAKNLARKARKLRAI